jgi:hypothetical protein
VDLPLDGLLGLATGDPAAVRVTAPRHYDLGALGGTGLAVTDAVALPNGQVLVTAAAEDSPTTYDDGPVVGSALAVLDDDRLVDLVELPEVDGVVAKVEGIAIAGHDGHGLTLVAVVDADDPTAPSQLLTLRLTR